MIIIGPYNEWVHFTPNVVHFRMYDMRLTTIKG